jgi:DNA-directed RNA polymerase subunit RPC12/RpoP
MAKVQFPCAGCRAILAIDSGLAGKVVACPRCKERTTVPTPFEVVEEPPPQQQASRPPDKPAAAPPAVPPAPPPRPVVKAGVEESQQERVRFPCGGCGAKMAVVASRRGQSVECPKCGDRTLVPDEDEGTYGLEGARKKGAVKKAKSPPPAAWWPDGKKLDAPAAWANDLARARAFAERREWKQALSVLHNLRKRGKLNEIEVARVLNKPLAYCLGRWASEELEDIDDRGGISKPMKKLLKKARERQMWAGTFSAEVCPLCDRTLTSTIGTTEVRTVAGSAFVCCESPTAADDVAIQQVRKVHQKLTLATGLDAEVPEVVNALADLPGWYRAVDLSQQWWFRSVTEGTADGYNSGGGGILGNILGDALGDALGGLLG